MAKKAVFIIAPSNFQETELEEPRKILEERGIETRVATKTRNKAVSKSGIEIGPDLALAEIEVKDFDAIIFIGGPGAADYFNDETALKLARDFKEARKVVGAICIAPSILANAGVLISKIVTAFPTEEQNLREKGAEYTGMQVEVDGNIVTARDPSAAREFGEKLAFLLES